MSNIFKSFIQSLFAHSDSSAEEMSNEEDSSAPEHSEGDVVSDHDENEKAVTFIDGEVKGKKETEPKTVTLQVIELKDIK